MPKKAFDNLSEENRQEMMDKAMQLYVDHPFEDITLKMILDTLSLHPTTFYRYFENKDELYYTALYRVVQKRGEYLKTHDESDVLNLFYFEEGTEPLNELEVQFTKTILSLPDEILLHLYLKSFMNETFLKVKDELRHMRYDSKLRPDVDDDLISFIFSTVQFNLVLFFREFGIKDEDLMVKQQKYLRSFFRHGLMTDSRFSEYERE
ncbi:MAG: TetR/AcrR family transcriptional regulator [Clostridiales Family XIII bacterium]|jgi:AcrR family transcriptional regulator|nr:TetR/AcrR family transcriptional regulator [Clostridiales Family XIII bacterium]